MWSIESFHFQWPWTILNPRACHYLMLNISETVQGRKILLTVWIRMTLSGNRVTATFQTSRSIARSVCDSWASCLHGQREARSVKTQGMSLSLVGERWRSSIDTTQTVPRPWSSVRKCVAFSVDAVGLGHYEKLKFRRETARRCILSFENFLKLVALNNDSLWNCRNYRPRWLLNVVNDARC